MSAARETYETLLVDVAGPVATITINRPDKRNSLSTTAVVELRAALAAAKGDSEVRAVVLTGAGDRAFCAGVDLHGVLGADTFVAAHERRGDLAHLFQDLWALGKPVVARVRGYALAGGFGLALSCDLIVAADDAVFGTPEIDVGMWPMMITVPMLRSMPPKMVLELQMTGRRVDAAEAQRIGFVNRVVPVDALDAATADLAAALAAKSPAIMKLGRDAFYSVIDQNASDALRLLQAGLTIVNQTEDSREGLRAFTEKRPPEYTGR
jgi:enoyl-CoA hydratase/carnithine racemase